ncbi:MAG: amidase [Pseudonocardiaceae bacterium]|nr:amidase [Pseudonocardiaceae bacterium]
MTTPADLTATELLAAYRAGELSPVEATRDVLERIERLDPEVNAFCLVDADRALHAATESERRWQAGEPAGLVDGVPTSIKDIFLTAGWPTLRGSKTISPDQEWTTDGPPVARLREHGAVLVGKTTTPELAWKAVTDSPLTGVTGNPWDTGRTPGGSSGGSATAVGLGMGPLSMGTDGGGSVRIPASFTGTVALKPTYGLIPHWPASPYGTLAHAGPMTRTVSDTALLLDAVCGFDSRDWSALAAPSGSFSGAALESGVLGLRVAVSTTLGYVDTDPEIVAAVETAAEVLADLGAEVQFADPGFVDPVEDFNVLWNSGAAKTVEHLDTQSRALLDAGLATIVAHGERYTALDYLTATATRMTMGTTMGAFHERYDLLLTPTMPITAFAAGHDAPEGWHSPAWTSWAQFSYPFNMTQQPAASVPCGWSVTGLPIGLQVIGPRHSDARVLAACAAFERTRPWADRRPPLLDL